MRILTKFLKALGNIYFIHNSISEALIWDFKQSEFVPVQDIQVFSGNIEAVDTKEKSKFPQHFFPEVGLEDKFDYFVLFSDFFSVNGLVKVSYARAGRYVVQCSI